MVMGQGMTSPSINLSFSLTFTQLWDIIKTVSTLFFSMFTDSDLTVQGRWNNIGRLCFGVGPSLQHSWGFGMLIREASLNSPFISSSDAVKHTKAGNCAFSPWETQSRIAPPTPPTTANDCHSPRWDLSFGPRPTSSPSPTNLIVRNHLGGACTRKSQTQRLLTRQRGSL